MTESYVKLSIKEYNDLLLSQSEKGDINKLKEDICRLTEVLYQLEKSVEFMARQFNKTATK
jgi:hypothetical protein